MKHTRKALLAVLSGILLLQLWPARRPENPPVRAEPPWSPEVATIMRRACYDCHSHETRWPWYAYVAPPRWYLVGEVERARAVLDFSDWKRTRPHARRLILERAVARAVEGEMAPEAYRLAHPEARLSDQDRQLLAAWLEGYRDSLRPLAEPNWELFRLPSRLWNGETVLAAGSWRGARGTVRLDRALLQVEGKTALRVEGQGVVLAGPGATVSAAPGVVVLGPDRPLARPIRLELPDLSQTTLSFCRDDGELGERNERSLKVYSGHGQFLLLEPELELGRFARSAPEALTAAEAMLAQDPRTRLDIWRKRFRPGWARELERLAREKPRGAVLEVDPGERGPR